MRAILINPDTETIEVVECESDHIAIRTKLQCDWITVVRIDATHHLYVDDTGLINGKHKKGFRSNLYYGILAGNAIIFAGDGYGGETDVLLNPEDIECSWVSI